MYKLNKVLATIFVAVGMLFAFFASEARAQTPQPQVATKADARQAEKKVGKEHVVESLLDWRTYKTIPYGVAVVLWNGNVASLSAERNEDGKILMVLSYECYGSDKEREVTAISWAVGAKFSTYLPCRGHFQKILAHKAIERAVGRLPAKVWKPVPRKKKESPSVEELPLDTENALATADAFCFLLVVHQEASCLVLHAVYL